MDPPCKPCASKFTLVPLFNFIIICTFIFIVLTCVLTWVFFAQNGVFNKSFELKENVDIVIPFTSKKFQNYTLNGVAGATSPNTVTLTFEKPPKNGIFNIVEEAVGNDVTFELGTGLTNVYTGSGTGTPVFPYTLAAGNILITHITVENSVAIIDSVTYLNRNVTPNKIFKLF